MRDRWLVRLFALRAAELCGVGEDIFFLRLEEVLRLLGGDETSLESIAERRESLPAIPARCPTLRR